MAKLVWRVKLVTELRAGETTEVEVARAAKAGVKQRLPLAGMRRVGRMEFLSVVGTQRNDDEALTGLNSHSQTAEIP